MESTTIALNGNQLSKIFTMFENRFEERFQKLEKVVESHELVLEFLKQQIQSFNYLVSSMKAASEINQTSTKFSEELRALIIDATSKISEPVPKTRDTRENNIEVHTLISTEKDSSNSKKEASETLNNNSTKTGHKTNDKSSEKLCERASDKRHKNEYCNICSIKNKTQNDSITSSHPNSEKKSAGFKIIAKKSPKKLAGSTKTEQRSPALTKKKVGNIRPFSVLSEKNSSTRSPSESSRGSKGDKKFAFKDPRMHSLDTKKKNGDKVNQSMDDGRAKDLSLSHIEKLMKDKKKSPIVSGVPPNQKKGAKSKVNDEDRMKKEIAEFKSILSKNMAENQKIKGDKNEDLKQEKPTKRNTKQERALYNTTPTTFNNNQAQKVRDSIDNINGSFEEESSQFTSQTERSGKNINEQKKKSIAADKANRNSVRKGENHRESKLREQTEDKIDNEFLEDSNQYEANQMSNRKSKFKTPSFGTINAREDQGPNTEDLLEETPRRLSVTRERNSPEDIKSNKKESNAKSLEEEDDEINQYNEDEDHINNDQQSHNSSKMEEGDNEQNIEEEEDEEVM